MILIMKNIIHIVILTCIFGISINAMAAEHTISLAYAQTNVKDFKNLKGVNAQYRYENQSPWGTVVSSTYTSGKEDYSFTHSEGEGKVKYFSVLAGPSYRFNEYISIYGLAGFAHIKYNYEEYQRTGAFNYSEKTNKTEFAYGVGVSINPVENMAVNIGYEGTNAKFYDETIKFNGFNIGLGYKF